MDTVLESCLETVRSLFDKLVYTAVYIIKTFVSSLESNSGYNSRFYHCYSQEDTLGMLKPICVRANNHSRKFEYRVLKRAMLRKLGSDLVLGPRDRFLYFNFLTYRSLCALLSPALQGPRGEATRAPEPCAVPLKSELMRIKCILLRGRTILGASTPVYQ